MAEEVTDDKKATEEEGGTKSAPQLGMGAWIGIAVAALVIGVIVGHFMLGGAGGSALNKSKLSDKELETAVGDYTYNGKNQKITAKAVMDNNGLLESSKDEEGNYAIPSSETIVSYARNQIISAEADAKGISVSDDDLSSYAQEMLGSNDFASIASSYNMDEETVKNVLRDSAKMNKLRDQVIGEQSAGEAPEAPTAPEVKQPEGEEQSEEAAQKAQEDANNAVKKEYADYIIKLAGDEWDAEKGAFKSADGPYATALADYQVTKDGANYNAAQAAYYVAYQDYSTKESEITEKWTDYVNDLLGKASISVYTLKS